MINKISLIILIALIVFSCSSTTPSRKVTRIGVDTTIDVSGRWNDSDSRMVADKIVKDVLNNNWLYNYVAEHNEKPVVIVGTIRNKTYEHINVETFCKDIERELINSGKVRFVASKIQREEIRQERTDQQTHSSEETAKKLANEIGADFMLKGTLNAIEDTTEGEKIIYYQADMELINLETNEIAWIGSKKIKKIITQSKYKW